MSDSDELAELRELKREMLLSQHEGPTTDNTTTNPRSQPVHVTDQTHFNELISNESLVLVDFYADWCGPCQMLEPILEVIARNQPVTVAKVDIDQHQRLAQQHGVQGVPTLVLYAVGSVVEHLVGVHDKQSLVQVITQHT